MRTSSKVTIAVTVAVVLALAAAVVALAVGLYGMRGRADEAERRVEHMYETALCESLDTVTEAENDLAKMLVSVGREENVSLASDIRVSAGSAAARVATLPSTYIRIRGWRSSSIRWRTLCRDIYALSSRTAT